MPLALAGKLCLIAQHDGAASSLVSPACTVALPAWAVPAMTPATAAQATAIVRAAESGRRSMKILQGHAGWSRGHGNITRGVRHDYGAAGRCDASRVTSLAGNRQTVTCAPLRTLGA